MGQSRGLRAGECARNMHVAVSSAKYVTGDLLVIRTIKSLGLKTVSRLHEHVHPKS
jgi:hypothetical protein